MYLNNFTVFCYIFSKLFAKTDGTLQALNASTNFMGDFSNNEIYSALKDLSLSDLNALSQLIDSNNEIHYNTDGNKQFSDENGKNNNFNDYISKDFEHFSMDNENKDDKNWDEYSQHSSDLNYPNIDLQNAPSDQEDQRSKRAYNQLNIDQEYIKQLHDSFPRDSNENIQNNEGINTQEHIRVKRN